MTHFRSKNFLTAELFLTAESFLTAAAAAAAVLLLIYREKISFFPDIFLPVHKENYNGTISLSKLVLNTLYPYSLGRSQEGRLRYCFRSGI